MNFEKGIKDHFSQLVAPEIIPGLAVSVFNKSRFTNFCLGFADLQTCQILETNHYFEAASLTKTIVGILFSKLDLAGEINLNQKVSEIISNLKGCEAGGVKIIDLLTHTSGLPRLPSNLEPQNILNPYLGYTSENLFENLQNLKLGPNQYLYSNLGYALLGQVIEIIFKDTVPNVLRNEVLLTLPQMLLQA